MMLLYSPRSLQLSLSLLLKIQPLPNLIRFLKHPQTGLQKQRSLQLFLTRLLAAPVLRVRLLK